MFLQSPCTKCTQIIYKGGGKHSSKVPMTPCTGLTTKWLLSQQSNRDCQNIKMMIQVIMVQLTLQIRWYLVLPGVILCVINIAGEGLQVSLLCTPAMLLQETLPLPNCSSLNSSARCSSGDGNSWFLLPSLCNHREVSLHSC